MLILFYNYKNKQIYKQKKNKVSLRKFLNMRRKKQILPFLESVEILDAGSEGKAIARINERVVFVPFAVPGDIVDIQVIKKKKSFFEAKIVNLVEPSNLRIKPKCDYFGVCGGCKWQVIDYENQLKFKQKQVVDALVRIGKVDISTMNPIMGNDRPYYYRNKLEFTFSNFRWLEDFNKGESLEGRNMNGLGFHKPGMFDRIIDIQECHLMEEPSNEIRNAVKSFANENKLEYFNLKQQSGLLRNLIIRSANTGDLMVIVVFYKNDSKKIDLMMNFLKETFSQITSLISIINPKPNDSISDLNFNVISGKDHILETMTNRNGKLLYFKVGPKSFYQTNSRQAQNLYSKVAVFCDLKGNEIVYDLYTGTGTIANFIAENAKKVVGIEFVDEAINDAIENSVLNNFSNTKFFAGDMAKVLTDEFVEKNGFPDVIITDPPRAGMHPDVVKMLNRIKPEKIVYVSCNPATQARDLALLENYQIINLQPVDMFPQTAHVENIALLKKK